MTTDTQTIMVLVALSAVMSIYAGYWYYRATRPDVTTAPSEQQRWITQAKTEYAGCSDIEIDDDAKVSVSGDAVWVQAWVRIEKPEDLYASLRRNSVIQKVMK
jgi:hypothetical protein